MTDLNQLLIDGYEVANKAETVARQLEQRIAQIPGAKQLLPRRQYGQPVDAKAIRNNLTLSSLIMQDSAELSHYLGLDPSVKRRLDEEKAAGELRLETMRLKTEQLRQQNHAAKQQRERAASNPSPWYYR